MPEILIPGESEIIKQIIAKKEKIQKARNIYERQWLVNIAFLFGKQHFLAENKRVTTGVEERILWELKSEERKNKVKRTTNYILPLYRSLLARLLMMKAHTSVEPTTNSERDKSAARVGNEVLEDFWQMANKNNPYLCQKYAGMPLILSKAFSYALTTGRGYLKPYFNANTNAKFFLDGQIGMGPIGEVECQVLNQFDVFEDPLGQFKIEQKVLPVDLIKAQYGVEVKPEDVGLTDIEQQLLNMLEGNSDNAKYENGARIFEYWELPSEKYPQGRYQIGTSTKLVLDDVIPPEYKGRIPLFNVDYFDVMLCQFPQGMIDQLISLQEDYNYTITRIHAYKKWFAGKLKVPKKCKLETKYDDEVGQIVYYEQGFGEPHFEVPPSPPSFLMEELIRIRKDMEDIAGVHDSAMGRLPQEIKSGVAIENLSELDNNQLSPVLLNIEQQLSFFGETVLDIIEAKYSEPRLLAITGENEVADIMTFKGADIAGNRRIKVSIGSNMPMSKNERQQFIMLLADKGYIDRAKALELMEFGDLAGVFNSADTQAQKMEISEMAKGTSIEPNEWDYHQAHIKVIEDFLKSDNFKKLEQGIQQLLLDHRSLHQKFLRAELQAAANMNPGQPQG